VSSPTHHLSLQQLAIMCGFKRSRQAPSKSLPATPVAMSPSITIESRRISAQGVANPQWKTSQGNKGKIASWI
jgi:hypothetical protein